MIIFFLYFPKMDARCDLYTCVVPVVTGSSRVSMSISFLLLPDWRIEADFFFFKVSAEIKLTNFQQNFLARGEETDMALGDVFLFDSSPNARSIQVLLLFVFAHDRKKKFLFFLSA